MSKHKNKELNNQIHQAVQESASNPWAVYQAVEEHFQRKGIIYEKQPKNKVSIQNSPNMKDYDMNKLMDKLGDKMPPGIKQMMEQFIQIIPSPDEMHSGNFKKEMKKKIKGFSTVFKSPYQ